MSDVAPDRRPWLAAVGLLEIVAGLACACLLGLAVVGLGAAAATGAPPVPGGPWLIAGMYGPIALGCIVVGIGCMRARRWARAMSLIASWCLILLGVVEAGAMLAVSRSMPALMAALPQGQGIPPTALSSVEFAVLAAVMLAFFGGPGVAGVLFFSSAGVKQTVERHQPEPSWTDACPLDLLATSLAFGFSAIMIIAIGPLLPLAAFGRLLSGPAALVGYLIAAILLAALAWGLYRRTGWAGPLLVGTILLGIANTVLTMRSDVLERYEIALGQPPALAAATNAMVHEPAMLALIVVTCAASLAWLIHIVRRLPWRAI